MPKNLKITAFALILCIAFIIKYGAPDNSTPTKPKLKKPEDIITYHSQPENGYSPYNSFFGRGVYNNNTQNAFIIKNDNSTDVVVLLVNAYSNSKIRNEYIRKGNTFKMTGVPNGTYYLRWISGNHWSPNLKVGELTGGFQRDLSFSETEDRSDWMRVDGLSEWTVTLYTVAGGTVGVENINANDFTN